MVDHPLIDCRADARLEGNVNGPSLIRVPDWVQNPLGRYYLYFAHHEGDRIRLAFADTLTGPWELYPQGVLQLEKSGFPTVPPREEDLDLRVKAWVSQGLDGLYPHIASPDALINEQNQQIRLYYHGRNPDGTQRTRVALSSDGLNFTALKPERTWEGSDLPIVPSRRGSVMYPVNELHDPAIYVENATGEDMGGDMDVYLLYSCAGEQGLGIAKIEELMESEQTPGQSSKQSPPC